MKQIQKLINLAISYGLPDSAILGAIEELQDVQINGINRLSDKPELEEDLENLIDLEFAKNYDPKWIKIAELSSMNEDFIKKMESELAEYKENNTNEELNITNYGEHV